MGEAGTEQRLDRIPSMDGMRFLMCLGIASFHSSGYFWTGSESFQYVYHFSYFTDIFFIISGFFLTRANINYPIALNNYKKYIFFRLARIYPLYFVTLIFYVLLTVLTNINYYGKPDNSLSELWPHIFLLQGWGFGTSLNFNSPTWSLSALWLLYLVFPLIFVTARKSKIVVAFGIVLFLVLGMLSVQKFCPTECWPSHCNLTNVQYCDTGIFRAIPSFLYGVLLASLGSFRVNRFFATIGLTLVSASLFLVPYYQEGVERLVLVYALIFFFLAADYAGIRTPLSWKGFSKAARYSYGIYVIHSIIIVAFIQVFLREALDLEALYASSWGGVWRAILFMSFLFLSYMAAKVAYHLFENPVYRAAERLVGHRASNPIWKLRRRNES